MKGAGNRVAGASLASLARTLAGPSDMIRHCPPWFRLPALKKEPEVWSCSGLLRWDCRGYSKERDRPNGAVIPTNPSLTSLLLQMPAHRHPHCGPRPQRDSLLWPVLSWVGMCAYTPLRCSCGLSLPRPILSLSHMPLLCS